MSIAAWVAIIVMSLTSYRGYFIDRWNHVCSIVVIEAAGIDAACAQADLLLAESRYASIEIWEGSRQIERRTANIWAKLIWPSSRWPDEAV